MTEQEQAIKLRAEVEQWKKHVLRYDPAATFGASIAETAPWGKQVEALTGQVKNLTNRFNAAKAAFLARQDAERKAAADKAATEKLAAEDARKKAEADKAAAAARGEAEKEKAAAALKAQEAARAKAERDAEKQAAQKQPDAKQASGKEDSPESDPADTSAAVRNIVVGAATALVGAAAWAVRSRKPAAEQAKPAPEEAQTAPQEAPPAEDMPPINPIARAVVAQQAAEALAKSGPAAKAMPKPAPRPKAEPLPKREAPRLLAYRPGDKVILRVPIPKRRLTAGWPGVVTSVVNDNEVAVKWRHSGVLPAVMNVRDIRPAG